MKHILTLTALLFPAIANSADWRDEIIYFIMVDRFADGDPSNNQDVDLDNPLAFHGGDLRGIQQNLDYIDELGVTAIWLTPIALQIDHPIDHSEGQFFGHHGYWAEDLNQIDPRYGTESDLISLVDAAHERGIKVMLDVVYNHLGYGATMVSERPDWFRTGEDCGIDPITLCLAGLPDFRTELPQVRKYVLEAQISLAERTGIDGFRLDTFKHLSHEFWQEHRGMTRARLGDDFYLLGEVWDADKITARKYFKNDEADALFDFTFRDRVDKFLSGIYPADRLGRYLTNRGDVAAGHQMVPFLSSHDMTMFLATQAGNTHALTIAATLLMTADGPPVLVYGEALGRRGSIWPDNRETMPWNARDYELHAIFQRLIELRSSIPDLRGPNYAVIYAQNDVLVFARGDNAIVAVNRGDETVDLSFEGYDPLEWEMVFGFDMARNLGEIPPSESQIFVRRAP